LKYNFKYMASVGTVILSNEKTIEFAKMAGTAGPGTLQENGLYPKQLQDCSRGPRTYANNKLLGYRFWNPSGSEVAVVVSWEDLKKSEIDNDLFVCNLIDNTLAYHYQGRYGTWTNHVGNDLHHKNLGFSPVGTNVVS